MSSGSNGRVRASRMTSSSASIWLRRSGVEPVDTAPVRTSPASRAETNRAVGKTTISVAGTPFTAAMPSIVERTPVTE